MEGALGERADGKWSAFEVGLAVSRQNGKGGILEARELAGLYLFQESLIIHSAHLFETSMEHFLRVLHLIESTPDLDRRVHRVSRSHGEEGITLKGRGRGTVGPRLKFKTRTKGGGRGLSGEVVVLDEAMEIPASAIGALMPTMSAKPNPQIWYAGSAVDQMVHSNGVVFARLRERGHAGNDPSLAWFEWSVPEERFRDAPQDVADDPEAWGQANPALGIRITGEYVANERRSMDLRTFGTERLGVGDWPSTAEEAERLIGPNVWAELTDPDSRPEGRVAFAVDVSMDRTWAAIGAAAVRPDGCKHVEITGTPGNLDHRRGTRWVVPRLTALVEKWGPCAVVIDGHSPAASLIPELQGAGVNVASGDPTSDAPLVKTNASDMAQACGAFYDAAADSGALRHLGQSDLDEAVAQADTRKLSGAWAWAGRDGADITPLVAVTLALYGFSVWGTAEAAVPRVRSLSEL